MNGTGIKYYTAFLIAISFISCESDVDLVKTPGFVQKLVISAFISPSDTVSYFKVSSNRKIFGELYTEEPIGLVTGSLSDGINEVALDTFKAGLKLNRGKMQIQYGRKYKLKVSSANGLHAEAECSVPPRRVFSLEADTFSIPYEYSEQYNPYSGKVSQRKMDFRVILTDYPGEENFYRIIGKLTGFFTLHNPERNWRWKDYLVFNEEFINDRESTGGKIVLSTESKFNPFFPPDQDSSFLSIYLYNTEKSYYLFHKSLKNFNSGETAFSEATPVYSNINGGLGIFCSYTIDSLIVKLK